MNKTPKSKQRAVVQLIIEQTNYSGFDLGESFIEDIKELVIEDDARISLISSSSEELSDWEKVYPIKLTEEVEEEINA